MTEQELKGLPRWKMKEPNNKEFTQFKKVFLLDKANSSKEKELLHYIGELQSENDELKHIIDNLNKLSPQEYKDLLLQIARERAGALSDEPKDWRGLNKSQRKSVRNMVRTELIEELELQLKQANEKIKELEEQSGQKNVGS
jgi:hypothetical protein